MSKLQDEVDLLRSIPMFTSLPKNKLKLLAFASDRISFAQSDVMFRQGDEADAAYVVISGEADILVTTGDTETKVAVLGPDEFIGDMAILCDIPRTATVKANSPMEVLRIRKEHLNDLITDTPELAIAVLKEVVQRLAKTTKDLSEANETIHKLEKK